MPYGEFPDRKPLVERLFWTGGALHETPIRLGPQDDTSFWSTRDKPLQREVLLEDYDSPLPSGSQASAVWSGRTGRVGTYRRRGILRERNRAARRRGIR